MSDWRAWTNVDDPEDPYNVEISLETNRCGLWWILSTLTTAIGLGIGLGAVLFLVTR